MEYRANFFLWSTIDICWCFLDLLFFTSVVGYLQRIGDWGLGEALIVIGTFRLTMVFVWGWLFPSLSKLPKAISEGKLDLILSKPIDSQLLVSIQNFSFSLIPSIITGVAFIILGLNTLGIVLSIKSIAIFIYLILLSGTLIFGIYFSLVALSFFFDRFDNSYNIFNALSDATKYPAVIFPSILQYIFTFIIPISLMVIVPAESLFKPISLNTVLIFHTSTLVFLLLSRFIWNTGLKKYSSASS